ncbi:MAG: transcription antitermination factor NusB [Alphaproteobacteria bacterium]|nr:transcription antitermination factor NusB [Alphaproteobacteria bacterium]TAD91150.1 MAG: transcription antitermination factor NusB [Alphaproteobacteria bacterium]
MAAEDPSAAPGAKRRPSSNPRKPGPPKGAQTRTAARRAARLAAVQALYQVELAEMRGREVVAEFITHHLPPEADRGVFGGIVLGVEAELPVIDTMVQGALDETFTLSRLEAVLRAILRAGAFELARKADVPARVVIAEYIHLTVAFFSVQQSGLTNAVLDRLARTLRPQEFEG